MTTTIIYILISVLLSAGGQILLKAGMNSLGPLTITQSQIVSIFIRIGTCPAVILGLGVYVLGTVFWLVALSRVDLSYAYPFASLSYILMLVASWGLFNEQISLTRLLGTGVIIAGVMLIARG